MTDFLSADRRTPSRTWRRATWAYVIAYLLWALAMAAGVAERGLLNDLFFLPLYVVAGLAAWSAARSDGGPTASARGWRLVALAWWSSALGSLGLSLGWVITAPRLESFALVIYQLYFPCILAGTWFLIRFPRTSVARNRLLIDGLIVVVATTILAWYWVFRFGLETRGPFTYLKTLLFTFPGEVAVALGAVALAHWPADERDRRALAVLSVGTIAAVIADFIYEFDSLVGSWWSGPAADIVLALGAGLATTAGLIRLGSQRTRVGPGLQVSLALVPYLIVGVVASLALLEWWRPLPEHSALAGLVLGGVVLMGLLVLRLVQAQREFAAEARARAEQDARFRTLVQHSSDAILLVDLAGRILYASPSFGTMVGLAGESLAARRLDQLVSVHLPGGLATWLAGLAGSDAAPLVRWTAGEREIEATATDHSADPGIGGIVINARDVTERAKLEARLQQAQKLEAVGRFASSVAHDFNNVLTVIRGNVEFLRRGDDEPASPELDQLEAATERGATLARQLTALSRPVSAAPAAVDLVPTLRAVERTLRMLLPSSIRTTVTTAAGSAVVGFSEVQAEQVLLNLALNSRDAMPDGGALEVRLDPADAPPAQPPQAEQGWARLTVRDSGCGMPQEVLARAFEPFFTTKAPALGTGLGLASVRQVVESAGGVVTIDSHPGQGTVVTIFLPEVAAAAAPAAPSSRVAAGAGSGHLLVVDDEPGVRRILARHLEREGYQVQTREDGVAALEYLEHHTDSVGLVLTDVVMPNMGGVELVTRVAERWPEIALLLMSGTPRMLEGRDGPAVPAPMLLKPLELAEVSERIAEALRGRRHNPTAAGRA